MQKSLEKEGGIKELVHYLTEHLHDSTTTKDITFAIQELAKKHNINDATVITTVRYIAALCAVSGYVTCYSIYT